MHIAVLIFSLLSAGLWFAAVFAIASGWDPPGWRNNLAKGFGAAAAICMAIAAIIQFVSK